MLFQVTASDAVDTLAGLDHVRVMLQACNAATPAPAQVWFVTRGAQVDCEKPLHSGVRPLPAQPTTKTVRLKAGEIVCDLLRV